MRRQFFLAAASVPAREFGLRFSAERRNGSVSSTGWNFLLFEKEFEEIEHAVQPELTAQQ
jgi:hypothetical protein